MKPKQLIIPGAVLVGAILLMFIFSAIRNSNVDNVETSDTKRLVFGKRLPINDVTHVEFKGHGEAPLNIEVKDAKWTIRERGGYPADGEKIGKLLRESIWDLGYLEVVEVGASKLGRLGLLEPAAAGEAKDNDDPEAEQTNATIVTLKDKDAKDVGALWIGKKLKQRSDQFAMSDSTVGRFVKTGAADTVYSVDEQFNDVKTTAKDWLDKTFFKVKKGQDHRASLRGKARGSLETDASGRQSGLYARRREGRRRARPIQGQQHEKRLRQPELRGCPCRRRC